jgi:hypothetical protein
MLIRRREQEIQFAAFWAEGRLPTPRAQADAMILWIGDHQPTQFELVEIHRCLAATLLAFRFELRTILTALRG